MRRARPGAEAAFTLLELLACIVIILILATMLVGVFDRLRISAETSACEANLRSLYVAVSAHIQDRGGWPQISSDLLEGEGTAYAEAWNTALAPYGISPKVWVCPTVQRQLKNPDLTHGHRRTDYIATPFDAEPRSPYLWETQPWFIERAGVHEGGNRILFPSGKITPLHAVPRNLPSSG